MTFISTAEIAHLVKMANKLDEEGRTEEALVLDQTIQTLVTAAAKEKEEEEAKEKGPRTLSNKAKSKVRQVCKAAKGLIDADLDIRGEKKKLLRELETICERVCEIADELGLDEAEDKKEDKED